MESTRRRFLGAVSLVILSGCTAPTPDESFEGTYSWGFEESVFRPCDRTERWWVVDDQELVERYRVVAENDYEEVYVEIRGRLSGRGTYGHGGQYPRQLEVTDVLVVRRRRADDC